MAEQWQNTEQDSGYKDRRHGKADGSLNRTPTMAKAQTQDPDQDGEDLICIEKQDEACRLACRRFRPPGAGVPGAADRP